MAQRGKRINRNDNDSASCLGAVKRRKCRVGPAAADTPVLVATLGPSEEEETMASSSQGGSSWTPRPHEKISNIYNRSAAEPPAELYRKDLISAMKLPDSEPLSPTEYWVISDQWKQEWEKGVQVPVNPDSLPEPMVTLIQTPPMSKPFGEFKLPKKFLRISKDEGYSPEDHYLSTTPARAEKACGYDLDDVDIAWLDVCNGERALCGLPSITEAQLERIIEELEHRCWDKIQTIVKNEEGLGIEFDENVICDVCRSPDSEEGNEMVFCDCCNICVHQACYGITSIPDGSWLCRTCSLGQRPACVLCPNAGGAMKSTRSGQKWAHVSCALWIPEVSIGCVERMEPITKISSIPQSRWALICVLCRKRVGACIQCSIKTCKTAYHVTCAFKHGLEMKAIIEDEQAEDGVKLRSYCQKHGKINTKDKSSGGTGSGSANSKSDSDDGEVRRKKRKDMSSEEKNQARAAKLQEIEAEFDKHLSLKDIPKQLLDVDADGVLYIYNYWKLKRRAGHNKPLLPPRSGELSSSGMRAQGMAADNEKLRKFVQLRQDLERVRNLCYMVNRREKLCRTFLRLREQTFFKQALLLSGSNLTPSERSAVLEANHGPSIYDHLYSHDEAKTHEHPIESFIAKISGNELSGSSLDSINEKKQHPDFNGASNKRLHFNGSAARKKFYSTDLSSMSASDMEETKVTGSSTNKPDKKLLSKTKLNVKVQTDSSTADEEKRSNTAIKSSSSKVSPRRKVRKTSKQERQRASASKAIEESSESDTGKPLKAATRSRTLQHMELELDSASGSESDELIPIRNKGTASRLLPTIAADIYSDTDDSSLDRASTHSSRKPNLKSLDSRKKEKRKDKLIKKDLKSSKESLFDETKESQKSFKLKKKECIASALIVPQRQAAKKASENIQRSTNKKEASTGFGSETIAETKHAESAKTIPTHVQPKSGKEIKEHKSSTSSSSSSSTKKSKSDSKISTKESKIIDSYDIDRENAISDSSEILSFVPQRQAAKKAAEHIKSGISSKSTIINQIDTVEIVDNKTKKEAAESSLLKKKLEAKKEETCSKVESPQSPKKPTTTRKSSLKPSTESSSSSSSSSSCSSSSESSDSDDSKSPEPSSVRTSITKERSASSSSSLDSDSSPQSSSRIRTSVSSRRGSSTSKTVESKLLEEDSKASSISSSSGTGRKLKKLPDKKLKTSDGRHGHEFQPPSTERDESSRRASAGVHKISAKANKEQQAHVTPKHKTTEQKEQQLSPKKSAVIQPQQQLHHQQHHQPQTQTDESVLSRPRDNDGTRNLLEFKSSKKTEQPDKQSQKQQASQQQQQQQSTPIPKAKKEDAPTTSNVKTNAEARKRKSSGQTTPKKEDKTDRKDASSLKREDKKLSSEPVESTELKDSTERDTYSLAAKDKVSSVEKPSSAGESPSAKGRPKKANNNKSNAVTLEEEMQQRRAERDSPKKSSKCLDKLLEKREHLDKLTRSRDADKNKNVESLIETKDKFEDDHKNRQLVVGLKQSTKQDAKLDLFDTPLAERLSQDNKIVDSKSSISNEEHQPNQETVDYWEEKYDKVNTTIDEKENSKKRRSINRSIFSPQHTSAKDSSVPELFDFDQDILGDDMVNDDGFTIPRDAEERAAPLSFSFNNELLFKEDKEDSARETLNLVEKLRLEMSKKTNSSQVEIDTNIGSDSKLKSPILQKSIGTEKMDSLQVATGVEPVKVDALNKEPAVTRDSPSHKQNSCQPNNNEVPPYLPYSSQDNIAKVTMAERAKLDRAEADERWVPPSTLDNFNAADQLSAIIDSQTQRYVLSSQQFANDLNSSVLATENASAAAMVDSQLQKIENQDQSYPRQPPNVTLDAAGADHAAGRLAQNLASLVEQQVGSLPSHLIDEMPAIEMINRHLISVPNMAGCHSQPIDDEHSSEIDRALDKDSIGSELIRPDYGGQGSPYNDVTALRHGQDTRWAESQVLPSRRSTSSSITSASSVDDHAGITPYKGPPASDIGFQVDSFNNYEQQPQQGQQNVGYPGPPVSLFATQSAAGNQLTYPSPGSTLFPPQFGAPFPSASQTLLQTHGSKDHSQHGVQPCTAAFTSSQHNMAFTAAMVSPDSARDLYVTPTLEQPPPISESSAAAVAAAFLDSIVGPESTTEPATTPVRNEPATSPAKSTPTHGAGKRSPAKPTRTSARVTSLQAKSPGKSPRQQPDASPAKSHSTAVRSRGRGSRTSQQPVSRGRGRGRGRGRPKSGSHHIGTYYTDESIQHKLQGSVYDFDSDEDSPAEAIIADLRTMRERKKSVELASSERRDSLGLDSLTTSNEPLPAPRAHSALGVDDSTLGTESEAAPEPIIPPLLPGPVDMRTYSASTPEQPYANQLFAPYREDATDVEKDSTGKRPSDTEFQTDMEPGKLLKVKIKGPFLDANYGAAAAAAVPIQTLVQPQAPPTPISTSGTSNLRRMRKKELLRQYCSQDMNMDDPAGAGVPSAPPSLPPISRTVITIPKAVASMTSIPTREDYKAVVDLANLEKKRRKERASLGLGYSDALNEDDVPSVSQQLQQVPAAASSGERRRSIGSAASSGSSERRRGRQQRPSSGPPQNIATATTAGLGPPKLKIKIGQEPGQEDRSSSRPPKKRLSSIPASMPEELMEELKRESLKFRRKIMMDFDNGETAPRPAKPKRDKKDKNGKRKKKANRDKEGRVELLAGGDAPPKLIIRLGKSEPEVGESPTGTESRPTAPVSEKDPVASEVPEKPELSAVSALRNVRCTKNSPIRLKLTRCQEGYELKQAAAAAAASASAVASATAPVPEQPGADGPQGAVGAEAPSSKEGVKQPPMPSAEEAPQAAHNSPNCPPAPLPQGCQVR